MSSVSAVNSLLSSTVTTTPAINVSSILAASAGVSTPGIDVNAAVAAGIYADRASERIWQAQQATLTSQTTALTAIQNATTSLNADLAALNNLTGPMSARTVSSSNSNAVTATAASGTIAGTHTVVVQNVASTASWYSDLASSATATLPSAAFTLTNAAGASVTLTTGHGGIDSLNDLAGAINTATGSGGQSLGVTARVVSDSTGSRLAIISNASGSAADFSITSAPTTGLSWSSQSLGTGQTLGANTFNFAVGSTATAVTTTAGETLTQLAAAVNANVSGVMASVISDTKGSHLQVVSRNGTTPFTIDQPNFGYSQAAVGANASLTVDGVPISSATNSVTGALAGVTLNLLGPTSVAGSTLTVASDASQASAAINKLVSDYNTAIGLVNAQFQYNAGTSSQGVLGSDPTVRALQNTLMQALNYVSTPGIGTTTVNGLSDLGISAASDGTLTVDSATLNAALVNNASDVQNFFQGASLNGFANAMTNGLSSFTNPGSGAFSIDLRSISNTSADLTKHISDFESIYIANQQTILTAMYSKAEIALQQLPTQMAQINAELGNNTKGS